MHDGRVRAMWKTGHDVGVSTDMRVDHGDGSVLFLDPQTNFPDFYCSLGDGNVSGSTARYDTVTYSRSSDLMTSGPGDLILLNFILQ